MEEAWRRTDEAMRMLHEVWVQERVKWDAEKTVLQQQNKSLRAKLNQLTNLYKSLLEQQEQCHPPHLADFSPKALDEDNDNRDATILHPKRKIDHVDLDGDMTQLPAQKQPKHKPETYDPFEWIAPPPPASIVSTGLNDSLRSKTENLNNPDVHSSGNRPSSKFFRIVQNAGSNKENEKQSTLEKVQVKNVTPFFETVRKKSDREDLRGFGCQGCKDFYELLARRNGNLGSEAENLEVEHFCNHVSRHRFEHTPPNTPPGFWDIRMTQ